MSSYNRFQTVTVLTLLVGVTLFLNSCVKDPTLATIITDDAENISTTTATVGGRVTDDGGATVTVRGVCWGLQSEPEMDDNFKPSGTGKGEFTTLLEGLQSNTLYYVRAFAQNSVGVAYGNEITFTTGMAEPAVTTGQISAITNNSAVCGGTLTDDSGAPNTERGICWSTSPGPDLNDSYLAASATTGTFSVTVTGLQEGTRYYVRAYAKNEGGTAYGQQAVFNTKLSDIEGNLYGTVNIGTQVWTTENLRTTRYNDNTPIPNVSDDSEWISLTTPAYCWLRNSTQYKEVYGALYNWYTAETGKLCPDGWHVPTDAEFKILEQFLGMTAIEANGQEWRGTNQGTQMKSSTGWEAGQNGTNSSGFSALPGGYRFAKTGAFNGIGQNTYWWSSELNEEYGWYRFLEGESTGVFRSGTSKSGGKYIRCVKN